MQTEEEDLIGGRSTRHLVDTVTKLQDSLSTASKTVAENTDPIVRWFSTFAQLSHETLTTRPIIADTTIAKLRRAGDSPEQVRLLPGRQYNLCLLAEADHAPIGEAFIDNGLYTGLAATCQIVPVPASDFKTNQVSLIPQVKPLKLVMGEEGSLRRFLNAPFFTQSLQLDSEENVDKLLTQLKEWLVAPPLRVLNGKAGDAETLFQSIGYDAANHRFDPADILLGHDLDDATHHGDIQGAADLFQMNITEIVNGGLGAEYQFKHDAVDLFLDSDVCTTPLDLADPDDLNAFIFELGLLLDAPNIAIVLGQEAAFAVAIAGLGGGVYAGNQFVEAAIIGGLDKTDPANRPAIIAAVNTFLHDSLLPIVRQYMQPLPLAFESFPPVRRNDVRITADFVKRAFGGAATDFKRPFTAATNPQKDTIVQNIISALTPLRLQGGSQIRAMSQATAIAVHDRLLQIWGHDAPGTGTVRGDVGFQQWVENDGTLPAAFNNLNDDTVAIAFINRVIEMLREGLNNNRLFAAGGVRIDKVANFYREWAAGAPGDTGALNDRLNADVGPITGTQFALANDDLLTRITAEFPNFRDNSLGFVRNDADDLSAEADLLTATQAHDLARYLQSRLNNTTAMNYGDGEILKVAIPDNAAFIDSVVAPFFAKRMSRLHVSHPVHARDDDPYRLIDVMYQAMRFAKIAKGENPAELDAHRALFDSIVPRPARPNGGSPPKEAEVLQVTPQRSENLRDAQAFVDKLRIFLMGEEDGLEDLVEHGQTLFELTDSIFNNRGDVFSPKYQGLTTELQTLIKQFVKKFAPDHELKDDEKKKKKNQIPPFYIQHRLRRQESMAKLVRILTKALEKW